MHKNIKYCSFIGKKPNIHPASHPPTLAKVGTLTLPRPPPHPGKKSQSSAFKNLILEKLVLEY
jgi:hypothetical protein